LLLIVLINSCASQDALKQAPPALEPYRPELSAGPQFPDEFTPTLMTDILPSVADSQALLPRGSSFSLVDGFADGKDFSTLLPSQRISQAGSSAVFAPAWPPEGATGDKAAYGIYDFTLPAYFGTPVAIDLSWSDAPDSGLTYVGLANFNTNRWFWKPVPVSQHVTYGGFANFIGPADNCMLAIVVLGTNAVILDSIQISTPQPPTASLIADVDSGIAPLSVNFDGSGSIDPDGSISNYEWDLDGDGLYNETGPELSAQGNPAAAFIYDNPGSYVARLRVTDNDANQSDASAEINVAASQPPVAALSADFTSGSKPLSVTFNATASMDPDGSITDYEWDFDGDGTYGEAGPEADNAGDPTPLPFTYTSVGSYSARVRVTDNDGGKDSETLVINVSNTPPTASLSGSTTEGDAPLAVSFDASLSSDPGGAIVDYEWDLDGDNIFNEAGTPEETARGNSSTDPFVYTDPGFYTASVRVTDDDTAFDTETWNVTAHGWVFVIVHDPAEGNANQTQTALIDGKPAMFYRAGGSTFKYSRSTTTLGLLASDWVTVTVASTGLGNPGRDLCFADVNGSPAVAYTESPGTEDLYYQVASGDGMDSAQWTLPLNLDSTASSTGYNPEIVVVAGSPAIAYDRNSDLYYTRASTAKGSLLGDWSAPINIQGADSGSANGCCFGIVNGNPAVAYYRYTGGNPEFEFVRSSTATGSLAADWSGKVQISNSYGPNKPAMFIANGNPAICFMDSDTSTWRYIRATSSTGATWGAYLDIGDGVTDYLTTVSGTVVNGFPMSVAWRSNMFDLMFTEANDTSGTIDANWSAPAVIDGQSNNSGSGCEIIEVDGKPAIGYVESIFSAAKYAIRI
jgi:PKD repeat protein